MDDPTSLIENDEFITDCARYAEGLLSEKEVKKKHHFDDNTWTRLGEDETLIEAIEAEKARRIRNGSTKRERAQQLVVQAPDVLGGIMLDASASPKHPTEAPPSPEIIRMGPAAATLPPAGPKAHPAEKFLSWLLNHWTKPTISLREICRHGPSDTRNWESAMDLAETLVQRGWFIRRETQRRDMRVWQILREPPKF